MPIQVDQEGGHFKVGVDEQKNYENLSHMGTCIDVEGYKIHYYEEGEGQPLLLVHGIGQSIYTWRNNIQDLSTYFRVIAIDMIGCGQSDKPELEYSIRNNCEFLRAFLDAMEIETIHIVAFSSGAIQVLDFIQNYPERIEKVVLISPGGLTRYYPMLDKLLAIRYIGDFCSALLNPSWMRKRLLECFFDETNVTDKMVEKLYKPFMSRDCKGAMLSNLHSWNDSEVFAGLGTISHSILLVWGQNDQWHPSSMMSIYEEGLQNLKIQKIRNCGHLAHEEKYREFNLNLLEFITGEKFEKQGNG